MLHVRRGNKREGCGGLRWRERNAYAQESVCVVSYRNWRVALCAAGAIVMEGWSMVLREGDGR